MKRAKAFGEMNRMELQTAVDKVGVMYDYYSCDKQFLKANEGIVKGLVETSVTTANAYEIGTRSTELLMRCDLYYEAMSMIDREPIDVDDLKEELKLTKMDSEVSETASTQTAPYVLYTGKGDMMKLFYVYGELNIESLMENDDMSTVDAQDTLPIKRVIVKHSTYQERMTYLRCVYYDIQEKNRSLVNRKAVEGVSMDEFESFYTIFDRVKDLMYGGSHARKMKTVLDLLLLKQTGGVEAFIKEIVKLRDRFAQQGMPINDLWSSCILISLTINH